VAVKAALADALAGALVQLVLARDVDLRDNALQLLAELFADRAAVAKITAAVRADMLMRCASTARAHCPTWTRTNPCWRANWRSSSSPGRPRRRRAKLPVRGCART
jgi:hypothetical protein